MSSDDQQQNSSSSKPFATFSGTPMPFNVSTDVDEDEIGEETTRRVGVAPSFAPSFGFREPPSAAIMPSFSTVPQKAMSAPPAAPITAMSRPTKRSGWVLSDVPTLPEFHPLDRSAVFVSHTSASEVSARVAEVLRERSIEAKFDNIKAKAKCRTADNVDFRVRLYRGRNQYSHGIIVEVQRRFGATINFCKDASAILDAAQGKAPSSPPLQTATGAAELPLVTDPEDDYDDDQGSSISTLDFVSKMLRHPSYDSHFLALQTLVSLSDASKMGFKTARKVSAALVDPDNEVGSSVVGLVVDSKPDEEETFGLRVMALTVLANALNAVRGNISPMLRERLRPVLLKELKDASRNPQMACLAAKCLEPLIDQDHNNSELHSALDSAREVGQLRHAGLSRQAELCIQKISSRY